MFHKTLTSSLLPTGVLVGQSPGSSELTAGNRQVVLALGHRAASTAQVRVQISCEETPHPDTDRNGGRESAREPRT